MRKPLLILLLHLLYLPLFAQTIIVGTVTGPNTNDRITKAEITLYKLADKSFVQSAYSDDNGKFSIALSGKPDNYYIEIGAVGFQKEKLVLQNLEPLRIILHPIKEALVLDEVQVVARNRAISIRGDKIVYDLEQMGISSTNNGLETMQQLPGITLDKDENIKYRGSTGIQIMINGKKSMLQGDALREFIRSLNGNDIKSIEIISQPSARYEATGTTGILNIVLHKNRSTAIGGNVYTYGAYGDYFKHKSGGRFFYNDDQWSVNASGSYYNGESFNDRFVDQTITLENGQRDLRQNNYWKPKTESGSFNIGVERKITKNQLISTEWQWYKEHENAETKGNTFDYLNNILQDQVALTKESKKPIDQLSGNIFYNYTSDSSTSTLDVQINYGHYKTSTNGFQQNTFATGDIDRLDGLKQTKYNMFNTQLDWNQKLTKGLKLEVGSKYAVVDMTYLNRYEATQGSDFSIPDSLMINDFRYKEKLLSAYSQLNYALGKWNFLGGLRMENYRYDAHSNINKQTNADNYTNWFPSASASYEKENNQYRLSYSKRISRPDYLSLNPYFEYLDAYSIEKGNPNLKPQTYHSFELNYIYKNTLSFGLYGYLYSDGFVSVVDYQEHENYNILYKSNASKGARYGLSSSIPYKIGQWWSMQYNLDAYLTSEKSAIENYSYDGKGYGYEFNTYHRFTLPRSWVITWNGFLSGRNKTETGYTPMLYDFSTAVQKSFMEKKIQVNAGCNNILKKSMWNAYTTVGNVATHWVNKWETRRFYVQVMYRFGGTKEKKVKTTALGQEQNRM